jgi:pyridoxamine 5'-phosphate oxidase
MQTPQAHPFPQAVVPSFDDPFGMLLACHEKMRRQLGTLARLQRHLPEHGADAHARAAASAILKYFDHAAPNHHADEDASLLPRVLARAPDLARTIAAISAEHRTLERHWRKLRRVLSGIAAGRNEGLSPALVRTVCEGYLAHLDREETRLLPRARECLDAEALADIGREFAARRGVELEGALTPAL